MGQALYCPNLDQNLAQKGCPSLGHELFKGKKQKCVFGHFWGWCHSTPDSIDCRLGKKKKKTGSVSQ